MGNITEIRFHGRGGQGAKTAADLLAMTALETGKFIQSFPEYGPERAGAPMKSFTRISDSPINLHCGVTEPDIVVVIDPTLVEMADITEGIKENGMILINTSEKPVDVRKKINWGKGRVLTVDATKIALETLKLPLPNTPMLGALIKATEIVKLEQMEDSIKKKFLKKIGEEKVKGNLESIRRAYNEVISG